MSEFCRVCLLAFVAICDMCLDHHQSSVLSIFLINVTFSKGIVNMANIRVSIFSEWPYLVAIHRFITIKFLAWYQESIFAFSARNLCCNFHGAKSVSKADIFSPRKKTTCILWYSKFLYWVHISPVIIIIVSQISPVHALRTDLRSILILFSHLCLSLHW
jgi:hypothetical protein